MDGQMDGWTDGRYWEYTPRRPPPPRIPPISSIQDGWLDGWMDEWMDGWIGGWMDGGMNGWADGWMGGWMDG